MTTTICLTEKRQVVLPKKFCEEARMEPGTSLRVTQIGKGLYITPIPEPSQDEFLAVIKEGGGPGSRMTKADLESVMGAVKTVRKRNRNVRRS